MSASISTAGFTPQENSILLNPSISIEAKSTLNLLKFFDRGRGCFAKKETLCRFLKISSHRLRKALRELEALKLITIERRGQGKTDIIWVVRTEETPELPEPVPPPLPDDPATQFDDAILADDESLTVNELERGEDLDMLVMVDEPVEADDLTEEIASDPDQTNIEIQNLKFIPLEEDILEETSTTNTPSTELDSTEPPDKSSLEESNSKEIIDYFFQIKEQRSARATEISHWNAVANQLLNDFAVHEIKEAIDYAVNHQQARLFYFIGLSAPSYIHEQRKERQVDELEKQKKLELQQQQQEGEERQFQREERRENNPHKAETQAFLDALSQNMRPQSFKVWFAESFIEHICEDYIILNVASKYIANFIEQKYMPLLRKITGKQVKLEVS